MKGSGGKDNWRGAGGTTKMDTKDSWWSKSALGRAFAGNMDMTPMNAPKGTVRNTGAGRTGAKGDDSGLKPAKSAMNEASAKFAPKAPKAPKAPGAAKYGMGPMGSRKASASKPSYKAKGPADYNKDVGAFYLQATKDMFSPKAGGSKGKKK